MATQVQNRRGSTAQHSTFTGASGELTVDTDKKTVVVHDGTTAGGAALLRENQSNLPTSAPTQGLYNAGSGALALSTSGTGRLFVGSTGNTEIISSGSIPLQVSASLPRIRSNDSDGTNLTADFYTSNGTAFIDSRNDTANGAIVFRGLGGGVASEYMRITSAGLVGIGTSSPDSTLNVRAGANNTTAEEIASFSRPDALVRAAISKGLISGTTNGIALGTTTNHPFALNTNGSERLYITNAGNVGIGTTSPGNELSVVGTANATTGFTVGSEDSNASGGLYNAGSASNSISIIADPDNVGSNSRISFFVDSTVSEAARIDSSGRLLVGTSSARSNFGNSTLSAQLQIEGTGFSNTAISSVRSNNDQYASAFIFAKNRGSVGANTIVQNNDELGQILFSGNDGSEFVNGASITAYVDGTPGTNDMPGRLVFSTTADGASSPTEALRITNDRVVCYNQPAPTSKSAAATLTIAELKTGIVQYTGAAATLTLPTGTLTEGGFSGVYTNMTFEWSVINTGSGTCTIDAGSGHTIVGGATVAAGASGRFASRRTAANTFVSYRLS